MKKKGESKPRLKEKINMYRTRLKWIYGYGRRYVWAIIFYTLLGMTGTVVTLLSSLVSKDLVDIITGHRTGELIRTFVLLILSQLVVVLINNISSYISNVLTMKVENTLKADIYDRIMTTKWEELSDYHSGDIVSRWAGDTTAVASGLLNLIPNAVLCVFRFASALYMVLRYDPTFVSFALLSIPLSYFVSRKNMERFRKINMDSMKLSARMSSFTQESFSNMQNVKALDMLKLYSRRLRELQKDTFHAKLRAQRTTIINSILLVLVQQTITYSTYGWGVYRVWSGAITYGTMTMFLGLSQSLAGSAQSMLGLVPSAISLTNSAQRIMDIADLPKEDYSHTEEVEAFYDRYRLAGIGLRIDRAEFTYRSGTKVFKNATFHASPREIVGLVGPSGEGKTTMLRLLLSIVEARSGEVLLTGGDAGSASPDARMPVTASSRSLFAYMPQGNTLFPGTIAENMRNVKEDATDDEIIRALKEACAWEFVSKLPDTIYTEIKERGGGFSEGQAQRLAIARALLRRSPILLLDEATSALDVDTQRELMKNILDDDYPRTCIVTTHRPEVMEVCDRVYEIDEGEIHVRV